MRATCVAAFATILVAILALVPRPAAGNRIARQKIYQDIQNKYFCFRRLNATHQIGCQSDGRGNVGVIHFIEGPTDIEWVLSKGPTAPFIPVVTLNDFSTANLISFRDSDRVTGVVLVKSANDTLPDQFSPDKSCPNENFGLYTDSANQDLARCAKQEWNSKNAASNMLFEDYGFPIFLVDDENSIQQIRTCYDTFNKPTNGESRSWPLCAIELFIQMHAAVNTQVCMRRNDIGFVIQLESRRYCDPLASTNVFATHFAANSSEPRPDKSVVVVAARLDSFSMFDELGSGADSARTSLITLITVAQALAALRNETAPTGAIKDVLFAAFDGEAFDYIGSSRTAFDMQQAGESTTVPRPMRGDIKPAPIGLQHISHIIELGQLGSHDATNYSIFAHSDPVTRRNAAVDASVSKLISSLQSAAGAASLSLSEADKDRGLPPSSMQYFLKFNSTIAGVSLANHDKEFTNKYYNSFLDTDDNLKGDLTDHIMKVSQTVTKTLVDLLAPGSSIDVTIDKELVTDLIECFMRNMTCALFQMVGTQEVPGISTPNTTPLYVSVSGNGPRQLFNQYVQFLLALLTGADVHEMREQNQCKQPADETRYEYTWMLGRNMNGTCVRSTVFATTAISPAFDNSDWNSAEFSTWTESIWTRPRVRIFLMPSAAKQWTTLAVGIFMIIVSFVIVYIINSNASSIFAADVTGGAGATNGNRLLGAGAVGI